MIVSVPEYQFSVNLNQMASVRAGHDTSYEPPWVIEICYANEPNIFYALRKFDNQGDMDKAYKLFVDRLPSGFNV